MSRKLSKQLAYRIYMDLVNSNELKDTYDNLLRIQNCLDFHLPKVVYQWD